MSITMNYAAGRKGGKRVSASPTHSNHQSPTSASSPLPRIKLNVRPQHPSRPDSSSSSRSRAGSSIQRRNIFSDDSSSDLTPPEEDGDDDDNDDLLPGDETEDDFPMITSASRKGKQRESFSHASPVSTKDKTKNKVTSSPSNPFSVQRLEPSRTTTTGPNGRERKRTIKLGDLARKRARDDKFGFGGDRFGGATPTQSRIGANTPYIDSDSTSSYGDDESEHENMNSAVDDDETDDEFLGTLPEALMGQEVEDLAYGAGHLDFSGMDQEEEPEWWQEQEDDEDFIANLTGSDIDALQSQSSVHASDSDDPMTSSTEETSSDDGLDEFGFPTSFADDNQEPNSDAPLILMENWDGQFVLVQPRAERSRSRRARGSQTNGSIGDSTSISAGEQQLMIDADADTTDSETDWSQYEGEDDGGDTTDSMAEEDMPVLDSPALDEIIAQQQLGANFATSVPSPFDMDLDFFTNPSIVVTDTTVETPALSASNSASAAGSPVTSTSPPLTAPLPVSAPCTPMAGLPAPVPMMGTFVNDERCAHAVIDGTHATTRSPFTRRRRNKSSDTASVTSSKRRSHLASAPPLSPMGKKMRFSSIPGHPRYIAARRAAQTLVDPLDRENTSEEDETAFSLEDMLDDSVLHMNDTSSSAAPAVQPELRHLFRFDKVPVSMYMRRNFNSNAHKLRSVEATPTSNSWQGYSTPPATPGLTTSHSMLTDTLADTLAGPASRMLISPLLAPVPSSEADDATPMSRKERRKARRRGEEMLPLHI